VGPKATDRVFTKRPLALVHKRDPHKGQERAASGHLLFQKRP
jgi:hypothetical protein